jgi:hypothetical protein
MNSFTRVTRDYVRLEDIAVTVSGAPVTPDSVQVALLPPRTKTTGSTTWVNTTPDTDGTPRFLVAGPDASPTGATVLAADRDVFVKVAVGSLVLVGLFGRLTLE